MRASRPTQQPCLLCEPAASIEPHGVPPEISLRQLAVPPRAPPTLLPPHLPLRLVAFRGSVPEPAHGAAWHALLPLPVCHRRNLADRLPLAVSPDSLPLQLPAPPQPMASIHSTTASTSQMRSMPPHPYERMRGERRPRLHADLVLAASCWEASRNVQR